MSGLAESGLIAGGLAAFVAVVWLYVGWSQARRAAELSAFSRRSGFQPVPRAAVLTLYMRARAEDRSGREVPLSAQLLMSSLDSREGAAIPDPLKRTLRFPKEIPLYEPGPIPMFESAHQLSRVDGEAFLFDYSYTVGSGRTSSHYARTVCHFSSKRLKLPAFSLRPERLWDKARAWAGAQDIDFPAHPGFSRKFLLRGTDEAAVRAAFSPHVLDGLERRGALAVEGFEDILIVYGAGGFVKGTALDAFFGEADMIFRLFRV